MGRITASRKQRRASLQKDLVITSHKTAQKQEMKEGVFDIRSYLFPTLTGFDIAFSSVKTDPVLLAEAKARGFYCKRTPHNDMFSKLFFCGGKVNFKKNIPEEIRQKIWAYLRALMGSFEPSHEDKEAVCALLLSEIAEA